DIVKRPLYRVSRFRVHNRNVSDHLRDWTHRAEIETANIEVTSHEEPLIVWYRCAVKPLNVGRKDSQCKRVPSPVHGMEVAKIDCRADIVHIPAQKTTRKLEGRRQAHATNRV